MDGTCASRYFYFSSATYYISGSFTMSTFNITSGTVYMGTGIWELIGVGDVWYWTGGTVYGQTSTIKITDMSSDGKYFVGGNQTYYNIYMTGAGTGIYHIWDSNTFNEFKVDTPPHTVYFETNSITTVSTWTVCGKKNKLIILNREDR